MAYLDNTDLVDIGFGGTGCVHADGASHAVFSTVIRVVSTPDGSVLTSVIEFFPKKLRAASLRNLPLLTSTEWVRPTRNGDVRLPGVLPKGRVPLPSLRHGIAGPSESAAVDVSDI
jgi:hypothetical protein